VSPNLFIFVPPPEDFRDAFCVTWVPLYAPVWTRLRNDLYVVGWGVTLYSLTYCGYGEKV